MNIVAIIPARGGSKSIPKKNIMDFCEKPLIAWSIEQALNSSSITRVYVSTDDAEIAKVSKKYGAEVVERPAELATDTASSEQALLHAIKYIEQNSGKNIDIVVFLQATSPLREPSDIDNALQKFVNENADSLFSAAVLDDFLIWGTVKGAFTSINYDYRNRGLRQNREKQYVENGSIYIFKPDILRKENNRLGGKIVLYEMEFWKSYEIDSYEDLEICEYYMKNKLLDKTQQFSLPKKIDVIIYDFDGVMTDNRVVTFEDGREGIIANRGDGLAISKIKSKGITQVIVSTEFNDVVKVRARKIGIPVLHKIRDKKKAVMEYCKQNGYSLKKTVYIGNDINDLEIMKIVGIPLCPSDAHPSIKRISKYTLNTKGGEGVIREFADLMLKKLK